MSEPNMHRSSDDWNKLKHLVDLSAENARLKADVERLRKFNDEALAHIAKEERKSRERLDMAQAEVELLRKAGDAMEVILQADFNGCPYESMVIREVIHKWRSAKDGKQP